MSESGGILVIVIGILVFGSVSGLTDRVTAALTDGTGLAIVGTALLLLGDLVSAKLRPSFWQFMTVKPKAFYAGTSAVTAFCWLGAAVAFASVGVRPLSHLG